MIPAAADILGRLRAAGVEPQGIRADSRRIAAGEVFAAWPGVASDGRRFLGTAVERGAAALLWESGDGFEPGPQPVPSLPVAGLRALVGHLAHEIYGCPSQRLWLAGVTGTNGKTTVSQMLARALQELGTSCAVIGTLGNGFPDALEDSLNTTPDAAELHRLLAQYLAAGADAVAMEVSSIGLDQGRVNGALFDVAVFTNLSRDHLDYHLSMEAYAAAKLRLFDFPALSCSVINLDDPCGLQLARRLLAAGGEVIGYTLDAATATALPGARVLFADALHVAAAGMRFTLRWQEQEADLSVLQVAPFNVSNLLAVSGALLARGVDFEEMLPVIARLQPPAGRMQLLGGVCEPLVVVDYAHTPDALEQVLRSLQATVASRGGRLVCVFGCGGDRDPGKRPLMGEVVRRCADRVLITSDNPRTEDPQRIIDEVAAGAGTAAERIVDRAQAIRSAIRGANANDVVVIAGKGHEAYQEVHGERAPFSDLEHATAALQGWQATGAAT